MSSLIEIKIKPVSATPDVVTVQEAKDYCRVDFNSDDTLFAQLIASSRERLEKYSGRVFLYSDCTAVYTQHGCGDRVLLAYSDNIVLPDDSVYKDHLMGESYIDTEDKVVLLEYKAGYVVDVSNKMPEWIKQAVLMDVAYRYENRGDISMNAAQINTEVTEYVAPYVKWSLI